MTTFKTESNDNLVYSLFILRLKTVNSNIMHLQTTQHYLNIKKLWKIFYKKILLLLDNLLILNESMTKERKSSKTSITSLFLIIFLGLMLIVFSITLTSLNLTKRNLIVEYKENASNQLKIQKRLMLTHLSTIESDLRFLPKLNEILRFKEIENEPDRVDIEEEFLEFIKSRNIMISLDILINMVLNLQGSIITMVIPA